MYSFFACVCSGFTWHNYVNASYRTLHFSGFIPELELYSDSNFRLRTFAEEQEMTKFLKMSTFNSVAKDK